MALIYALFTLAAVAINTEDKTGSCPSTTMFTSVVNAAGVESWLEVPCAYKVGECGEIGMDVQKAGCRGRFKICGPIKASISALSCQRHSDLSSGVFEYEQTKQAFGPSDCKVYDIGKTTVYPYMGSIVIESC